jgi:glutamate N-acetyltransferase/amino-acid N-acetyltransferase
MACKFSSSQHLFIIITIFITFSLYKPLILTIYNLLNAAMNLNAPLARFPSSFSRFSCCRQAGITPRYSSNLKRITIASAIPGSFDIPAAPVLIPSGPWKEIEGCVCAPKGFKAQGMYGGLRAKGDKADLALILCEKDAVAAGVFTLNVMCAAPVTYCKEVLERTSTVRAVLVNAGQANAATGEQGYQDSLASANATAAALGITPDQVLLESTGVIGRRIKMDALLTSVPKLAATLGSSAADAHRSAVAITTTDLVSKSAALEVELSPGRTVRLGGIAKGSGMIHPNMATMLAVITCDAPVAPEAWRGMFRRASASSFNQITVDGDTSTNDTVIGLTSGMAGGAEITDAGSTEGQRLEAALTAVLQGLAKSIAWDGEGATVLIECEVLGAPDDDAANKVAKSVVGSSLVKSAVFGHDPNWGRIAAAAGYSGVQYSQTDVKIMLGDLVLMEHGQPLEFDAVAASAYLKGKAAEHGTVNMQVSIGNGPGKGMAWGCDLSYDYVSFGVYLLCLS